MALPLRRFAAFVTSPSARLVLRVRPSPKCIATPWPSYSRQPIISPQRGLAVTGFRFDKVPDKEPDWGDEDDDEDDEDEFEKDGFGSGGSGGSGGGNNSRGGGGGGDGAGGGNEEDDGFFARIVTLWTTAVTTRPVLTKAVSTMLIGLAGDWCAQALAARLSGKSDSFSLDLRRFASIGVWAFVFMGPVLHSWYGTLDRMFVGKRAVWYKLLSDQLAFAPFFNGAFMVGTGCLEGKGFVDSVDGMRSALWSSMKANWMLWPAAQFVNFAMVPRQFQILWVNTVAFAWTIILTSIAHGPEAVPSEVVDNTEEPEHDTER